MYIFPGPNVARARIARGGAVPLALLVQVSTLVNSSSPSPFSSPLCDDCGPGVSDPTDDGSATWLENVDGGGGGGDAGRIGVAV